MDQPLAVLLRPGSIDDMIGQSHLVGPDGFIRKLIVSGYLPSLIFWGPPGCGKTTLAEVLAHVFDAEFASKSAVTVRLEEIRKVIGEASDRLRLYNRKTILFIDEIHRFNKAQQDALLPAVENGTVIFIGATTENPSFEVIGPLLSRCRVVVLEPLSLEDQERMVARGLAAIKRKLSSDAKKLLIVHASGDGRALLTILQIASQINPAKSKIITIEDIAQASQKQMVGYDDGGEDHFNTISAFIKSMRASDVDAALYYLAKMVAGGEDPIYIARRMVVFASEDVSSPTALVVANAVFAACQTVGLPECQENLAAGVVYLAQATKDRRAYDAYMAALSDIKTLGNLPVPMSIRNAPTKLMKDLGYGKDYEKYPVESLLPDKLKGKKYYNRE